MFKYCCRILLVAILIAMVQGVAAQDIPTARDTFFLNKKKGLLGRLGRSITFADIPAATVKIDEPFIQYKQKTIRYILLTRMGFERNFYDTSIVKRTVGVRLANAFHRKTRERIIQKNLFFKEGDPVVPYLLADNERYLRELPFIQDARLQIVPVERSKDSVDVWVITKDVFSLGGDVNISSATRGSLRIYDENIAGTGNELSVAGFRDQDRTPLTGMGAEYISRNLGGSFVNWTTGFINYNPAFNSGLAEETAMYTRFEKPLVSPYFGWTGALELAYKRTRNGYQSDSLYLQDYRYSYYNADIWMGYNLGTKRMLLQNTASRLRKFAAMRVFHNEFFVIPNRFLRVNDYQYADISGVLGAFTIFKQVFYKTRFVYGFGRSEDVPEGYTGSLIGGWTDKQGRGRPYMGIDLQRNYFNSSGYYSSFTLRAGGYMYEKQAEDISLLLSVDHFSRLKHLGGKWYHRWFLSGSVTKQIRPVLNEPLFLNSTYALPKFSNGTIAADFRGVVRCEAAFYNTWKLLGFRFSPFMFSDGAFLVPTNKKFSNGDFFSNLGAGVRTRNESLIFETVELRGYVFPRTMDGMKGWRIEFSTNIRFKYNSNFIKRPDFVTVN